MTGLRCGEAFALNFADVDLEQDLIFVHEGKFGKSRWVPISHSSAKRSGATSNPAVASLPWLRTIPSITTSGRRLYHTNAKFAYRQALLRCGLRGGKGCPGPGSMTCATALPAGAFLRGTEKAGTSTRSYLRWRLTSVMLMSLRRKSTSEPRRVLPQAANERFLNNFRQHVLEKKGGRAVNTCHPIA